VEPVLQAQKFKFVCPECGAPLDIDKLDKEGRIHILSLEFENNTPSYMKAGVLCPGCEKLVNPKTVL
jgi:hypothetical protein